MKTSEPNDYGEIDCKCNSCGDLKQSLEFIICDNFSKCGGCCEAVECSGLIIKGGWKMSEEFEKWRNEQYGGEFVIRRDELIAKAAFAAGQAAAASRCAEIAEDVVHPDRKHDRDDWFTEGGKCAAIDIRKEFNL